MKKFFAWFLRICCFAVIAAAGYTLVGCLLHVNDDHSQAAVMAQDPVATFQSPVEVQSDPVPMLPDTNEVEEDPKVGLSADGIATVNKPNVTVTAAFSNIQYSIVADLNWYVDGELAYTEEDCLLVEGSTKSYVAKVDASEEGADTALVQLDVAFQDKSVSVETDFPVERLGSDNSIVIRTEEITVTARRQSEIYARSDLSGGTGDVMERSDTGLLLAYESDNSGLTALKLKLQDGSEGWVDAGDMTITTENCTTDEDYTEDQKVDFVNTMGYDSNTRYLVWVSLYTQKVNVFKGYEGHWSLEASFDCATGVNETPTSTGVFTVQALMDRWDLGKTYVEPVLVFNGGEAFTSRPYDSETGEIADETMGEPASGGSVRMQEEDIQWMVDNIAINTMVVVY